MLDSHVMAGLVPAIHVLLATCRDVDARDKPGHDESGGKVRRTLSTELRSLIEAALAVGQRVIIETAELHVVAHRVVHV